MNWNPKLPKFYDDWAAEYAESFLHELEGKPQDKRLLQDLAQYYPGGLIADLGCGPGHIGGYLSQYDVLIEGIDVSPGMLEQAKQSFPHIRFLEGSFHNLPVEADRYDAIVAFYCLIHCQREALTEALSECRRTLKPGGRLLASFHEGEGVIVKEGVSFNFFTQKELQFAAREAKLSTEMVVSRLPYATENGDWRRLYVQLCRD